jgi:hypothetical protein
MASLREILATWVDKDITIVNPHSFSESVMRDTVQLETYLVTITEVGDDYVRLGYDAPKRKTLEHVDQIVPLREIKRVTQWGEERILHL